MKRIYLSLFAITIIVSCSTSQKSKDYDSFLSFDKTKIAYSDQGSGESIILLHGFISSGNSWNKAVVTQQLLDNGYRVIIPDMRGNGKSDKSHDPEKYKNDAEIKDIIALADHLKLKSYNTIGYSRGSIVLAKLLTKDKRITKAVMGGMGLDFTKPDWDRRIMFAKAFGQEEPLNDITRGAVEYATSIGADNKVLSLLQHHQPVTSIKELATISAKTLVIAGDLDSDNGNPAELQQYIPNSRLAIVSGDHNNTYKTEVFATAVLQFIKS